MRSLSKSSVELTIARVFAALAIGILCGGVTGQIANQFGYQLDPNAGYLVGILSAAGTWLASRKVIRVLQQTEDTMKIPMMTVPVPARLHDGGLKGIKDDGTCAVRTRTCSEPKDKCANCSADLKQEPQTDGSVRVTITVTGLSKREFNNLRARLEDSKNVPNTNWDFPKNQGKGTRTLTGVVLPGNGQTQALAKLEELTGKRV